MFRQALLVLLSTALVAKSANAFVAHPPTTRMGGVLATTRSPRFSTEAEQGVDATASEEKSSDLSPEFQAALDKTSAAVQAAVGEEQPMLLGSLLHFVKEYITASQKSYAKDPTELASPGAAMKRIMEGVQFGFKYGMGPEKFTFGVTHEALRGDDEVPIDFYDWGNQFFRPMIDLESSEVMGLDNLKQAVEQAKAGENVVFFANHQSEADPQVLSLLLEKEGYTDMAEQVYFVAGHKVTTDALAIPFSMGRNLICIHSKKHIDADPDTKPIKSRQNLSAMSGMLDRLKKGGTILWVAPSGGRDRRNVETGKTPIASFDYKTIDMFRLMGTKSKKPTHYYPMAMVSYELCPPPDFIEAGTGEQRNFRYGPVGISVGEELTNEGGLESRADFNAAAEERTVESYFGLREALFPGTAPERE